MIATFLWCFYMLAVYLITMLLMIITIPKSIDNSNEYLPIKSIFILIKLLERVFSFYEIIDAKLIGLIVFLVANLLTGLINLSIRTSAYNQYSSLAILHLHALASVGSGYLIYYIAHKSKIKNKTHSVKKILV